MSSVARPRVSSIQAGSILLDLPDNAFSVVEGWFHGYLAISIFLDIYVRLGTRLKPSVDHNNPLSGDDRCYEFSGIVVIRIRSPWGGATKVM
jgi:hypothetical protein